jgi:hypothetical protein
MIGWLKLEVLNFFERNPGDAFFLLALHTLLWVRTH